VIEVAESQKEAAAAHFAEMLRRGESVTVDEYVQCFPPDCRDELRRALESVVILRGWAAEFRRKKVPVRIVDRMLKPQTKEKAEEGRETKPRSMISWPALNKPHALPITSSAQHSLWDHGGVAEEQRLEELRQRIAARSRKKARPTARRRTRKTPKAR